MIRQYALACVLAMAPVAAMAEGVTHRVAIHVDQNDPQVMNMALNNAQNVAAYYAEQGDEVVIELVTYGPGLQMLVADKSPVKDRIGAMSLELPITFSACGNTIAGMEKAAGHEITLLDEAEVVPSGVVRLIELQEEGYAYVRP
ncbi:MAG: hypothetical protein CML66_00555 [Rhodobacteraceae bacterium]|nr:hypothetical protein [Paracoccaceae bacterium]MAY45802.1 hypothetical protein [Paracoccaceae bacterium]